MNYSGELVRFAHIAEQKSLVTGLEGNLSAIDRKTGEIYITPSHRMKCLLTEELISVVGPDGEQIGGIGKKSSEYFLHEAIYRAKPEVGAIIHCHCPHLTAYALRYEDFVVPENCALREVFRTFRCLPYGAHGSHDIHRGIEEALADSPVALLGGHGVVCVGTDLEDAIGLLEAAEGLAKTLLLAKLIGKE